MRYIFILLNKVLIFRLKRLKIDDDAFMTLNFLNLRVNHHLYYLFLLMNNFFLLHMLYFNGDMFAELIMNRYFLAFLLNQFFNANFLRKHVLSSFFVSVHDI